MNDFQKFLVFHAACWLVMIAMTVAHAVGFVTKTTLNLVIVVYGLYILAYTIDKFFFD